MEIGGYQAGDLQEERPIHVLAGAAVAGNLAAPKVVVAGLVYGQIVTRQLRIEEGGQVWGDVHAQEVTVTDGGKVHGWLHTIDEDGYRQLYENGTAAGSAGVGKPEIPDDLLPAEVAGPADTKGEGLPGAGKLVRLLQQEAGAALAARSEVEATFEQRVTEIAGDTRARVRELDEALGVAQQELSAIEIRLADRGRQLEAQQKRMESQEEELESVRTLLDERSSRLQQLKARLLAENKARAEAEAHGQSLEARLNESMGRADELAGRVESLESALQSSVQHTAEQEEALVHWQELAEVTQRRVAELEEELATARQTIEGNEQVVEQMRAQGEQVQKAWGKAYGEVEALQQELADRPVPLDGEEGALQQAKQKIGRLESALAEMEATLQEQQSQSLWYRASLKTTKAALQQIQQELIRQQETMQLLQREAGESRLLAEEWKGNVGRLSELLYEAEQRGKEKDGALRQMQVALEEARAALSMQDVRSDEMQALRQSIRQRDMQIEALEEEVDGYHEQVTAQRERLAEARAELAEGLVTLREMKRVLEKRTQEVKKIRYLATQRIQQLESELAGLREDSA